MIDPVRGAPAMPVAGARAAAPKSASPSPAASVPQLLDLIADLAQGAPPVDAHRIAQIRRAIADGSYVIDPNTIARAIIDWGSPRG